MENLEQEGGHSRKKEEKGWARLNNLTRRELNEGRSEEDSTESYRNSTQLDCKTRQAI